MWQEFILAASATFSVSHHSPSATTKSRAQSQQHQRDSPRFGNLHEEISGVGGSGTRAVGIEESLAAHPVVIVDVSGNTKHHPAAGGIDKIIEVDGNAIRSPDDGVVFDIVNEVLVGPPGDHARGVDGLSAGLSDSGGAGA